MKRKSGLADSPFFTPQPSDKSERSFTIFPHVEEPSSTITHNESKQASLQTSNIASKQASLLKKLRAIGDLKATHAATFRFPPELLEKLEEIEYLFRKEHKIKATKNMIVVAALTMLLCEFEDTGTESTLYQYLVGK